MLLGGDVKGYKLIDPAGIAVDSAGNVFISDRNGNNRIVAIPISTGIITIIN